MTGDFCSLDSTGKRLKDRTMGEMEQVGRVLGGVLRPPVVEAGVVWCGQQGLSCSDKEAVCRCTAWSLARAGRLACRFQL